MSIIGRYWEQRYDPFGPAVTVSLGWQPMTFVDHSATPLADASELIPCEESGERFDGTGDVILRGYLRTGRMKCATIQIARAYTTVNCGTG
jgi:hypothetical protein